MMKWGWWGWWGWWRVGVAYCRAQGAEFARSFALPLGYLLADKPHLLADKLLIGWVGDWVRFVRQGSIEQLGYRSLGAALI